MKRNSVSGLAGLIGLLLGMGVLAIAAPPASAAGPGARTLAEGTGMAAKPNADVRRVQHELRALGRSLGPAGVDGRFGPRTAAAVKGLQSSFGLYPDGIVGPKTRKLLRAVCRGTRCSRGQGRRVGNQQSIDTGEAAPRPARVSSSDDSLSTAAPTVVAILALLVLALAFGWWRSERTAPTPSPDDESGEPECLRPRVVGYLGESENGHAGGAAEADIAAQEAAIEAECERRGWELTQVFREVPGGREREALAYALERIGAGEATCLMVGELERVGDSTSELGHLLEWFDRAHAGLVVLDVGVDTTSREGALAASVLVSVTKTERRRALASSGNGWRANLPGEARMS
jgi:hypothetical protein